MIDTAKNACHFLDNLEGLRQLADNSVDAIITDSPYGLGKEPDPRKVIPAWLESGYYEVKGSGFMGRKWDAFVPQPILWKECLRVLKPGGYLLSFFSTRTYDWGTMAIRFAGLEIRDCIQWVYGSGFPKSKSHLKPANEPICVARKPGPLYLNIQEGRVTMADGDTKGEFGPRIKGVGEPHKGSVYGKGFCNVVETEDGRWPSNVIFDEETAEILNKQSGITGGDKRQFKVQGSASNTKNCYGKFALRETGITYNDKGGAARFFYVAKASPSERKGITHPTVKPVKLMEQLVKLYCPPGGLVCDPHLGSGATWEACEVTGRRFVGFDNDADAIKDCNLRMERYWAKAPLFQ